MPEKFDVTVIGSGTGGYAAAIRAAQKGASVAVIEKENIGGTCLNHGCIPSKTLLASAHTLILARNAAAMGVDIPQATPNWPRMQARKNTIVSNFVKGLTGLIKSHKVKIIPGRAIATTPNRIDIESDTQPMQINAEKIIIATGSEPIELPDVTFDGQLVISSKQALQLEQIPQSMVIIGGGFIGCELACLYAALGTNVTVVEALDRLIPMEDDWVSKIIERELKKLGIDIFTGDKVIAVEKNAAAAKVTLQTGRTINAEKVLVSVGRKPVCDRQTIENLNLELKGSAIKVNEKMQTNVPGVYAVGDVVATTFLAHGAFAEAQIAATNATAGDKKLDDYDLIPSAVYTFPEIASVGKKEKTCHEEGLDISIGRSFFKANGRSAAHNQTTGEIRVIKNNKSGKIIGVTMVGETVTELIAAARALIGTQEKITDISFPHPTVSEVLKEAAEDAYNLSLHNPPKT